MNLIKVAPWFLASFFVLLSKAYLREPKFPVGHDEVPLVLGWGNCSSVLEKGETSLSSSFWKLLQTLGCRPSYYGAPLNICLLFVSSIQFRRHFGERKISRNERSDLIDLGLFICFPSPCVKIEDTLLLRNSSNLPSLNVCVLFQLLINYSEWRHEFKYF